MTEKQLEKSGLPTEFIMSQKINIRDLMRVSKCGSGFHLWISPKLVRAYTLERGDRLMVRIEEVRYHNLREVIEK